MLLGTLLFAADDEPELCEAVLEKAEGDEICGVAGLLPTRLTGFHALELDSATRLRK